MDDFRLKLTVFHRFDSVLERLDRPDVSNINILGGLLDQIGVFHYF